MRYAFAYAALAATVSGHGLITQVKGANGAIMPGLSGKSYTLHHSESNILNTDSRCSRRRYPQRLLHQLLRLPGRHIHHP